MPKKGRAEPAQHPKRLIFRRRLVDGLAQIHSPCSKNEFIYEEFVRRILLFWAPEAGVIE
jgi:hypothetical protein